jgi:hypothetical protein
MNREPPNLTQAERAFLSRVNDELRADVNHISIFASICNFVVVLLLVSISLGFLGAVGGVMYRNGGLERFNTSTDTGFVIIMIGTALLIAGLVVTTISVWFVSRLNRAFEDSYEKTADIFQEAFEIAHLEIKGGEIDSKNDI